MVDIHPRELSYVARKDHRDVNTLCLLVAWSANNKVAGVEGSPDIECPSCCQGPCPPLVSRICYNKSWLASNLVVQSITSRLHVWDSTSPRRPDRQAYYINRNHTRRQLAHWAEPPWCHGGRVFLPQNDSINQQ